MSDGGWIVLLVGAACGLLLLYGYFVQEQQRRRLLAWLCDPEQAVPEGRGAWRAVFSALGKWQKSQTRAYAALIAQLERFRCAAETLPDGVVLLDDRARIEWLNTAAADQLSLEPAEDVGLPVGQLIRHPSFQDFLDRFQRGEACTQTAPPLTLTIDASPRSRTLALQLSGFPGTGMLLFSRDLTELTRTETLRRDFIANVSHELRTPITVIGGFLEQLTDPEPPPEAMARRFIGLMADQCQRMSRLVADLLTLSRLESDQEPLREDGVDVPLLVRQVLAEGLALSQGRHILEIGSLSATQLFGNGDELRTAFGNLVSNAVRYTPDGGRITVDWCGEESQATFSVTDSGIGIPAEQIPRLTERFYRVDKGRSTATGGTGLGLAIVKHVTARHQATLEIQSRPGKGSRFALTFPQHRLLAVGTPAP